MSGRERRIHSRTRTSIRARLHYGEDAVEGLIENVGEGGVFFATEILEALPDEGAKVEVGFEGLQGETRVPFRIPASVLRTERYFDGTAVVRAFAIRFDSVQDFSAYTWDS